MLHTKKALLNSSKLFDFSLISSIIFVILLFSITSSGYDEELSIMNVISEKPEIVIVSRIFHPKPRPPKPEVPKYEIGIIVFFVCGKNKSFDKSSWCVCSHTRSVSQNSTLCPSLIFSLLGKLFIASSKIKIKIKYLPFPEIQAPKSWELGL